MHSKCSKVSFKCPQQLKNAVFRHFLPFFGPIRPKNICFHSFLHIHLLFMPIQTIFHPQQRFTGYPLYKSQCAVVRFTVVKMTVVLTTVVLMSHVSNLDISSL